jgi:hypothetical protein
MEGQKFRAYCGGLKQKIDKDGKVIGESIVNEEKFKEIAK